MISINPFAVITCVALSMPLGFLWYGPFFGKVWAHEIGMSMDKKPSSAQMTSLLLYAFSSFLIALVLAHSIEVWMPSSWDAGTDSGGWFYALNASIWTWLVFPALADRKGGLGNEELETRGNQCLV